MMKRDLPPRLYFKDGGYYYVRQNKWTHLGGDLESATVRYRSIEHNLALDADWVPAWAEMRTYLRETFRSAKRNAKTRGIPFNLTREEFETLVARAGNQCEVTGITFQLRIRPGSERRPFAPSLDRIKASQPYSAINCRLVCGIVNTALSDWGDAVFWKMVRAAKRKHRDSRNKRRGIQ